LDGEPILDFPVPSGISFALIDPHSGQRLLPGSGGGLLECFRHGTEPKVMAVQPVKLEPEAPHEEFLDAD
jgi:hypothetical protein